MAEKPILLPWTLEHAAGLLRRIAEFARPRRLFWAMLAAFAVVVALHMGAWPGGSDTSGYLNAARLLREGRFHEARMTAPGLLDYARYPDFLTIPLGFRPYGEGDMVPTYPLGLPALIAAASFVVGQAAAPHVVMWVHALAVLVLMRALCRKLGFSEGWAAFGALMLALSPLVLSYSVHAMSDMPALVWVAAAILCAWPDAPGGRAPILAGVCLSVAVFVRPTNLLALVPVAVLLGRNPRRWLWFVAGGIPGGAAWTGMNHLLYGRYLTTGYAEVGTDFGAAFVLPTLGQLALWLPVELGLWVVAILALPFRWRRHERRPVLLVAAWALPWVTFYSLYRYTHTTWWYLRFLLPCYPALAIGSLFGLRELVERIAPRWRVGLATAAVAASFFWSRAWVGSLFALESGEGEHSYVLAMEAAERIIPADAVVVAMQMSGTMDYYRRWPMLRWEFIDSDRLPDLVARLKNSGRPVYGILFPFETDKAMRRLPGKWIEVGKVRHITFYRWEEA